MEIYSTVFISLLLFLAAIGLIYWNVRSWREIQSADLGPNEHDFYRRQYRRRIQTSAMLGILALGLFAGGFITQWIDSQQFIIVYWLAMLIVVAWMALLAAVDIWATKYHFGKLKQKFLIEQAKLRAEISRVKSVGGNGKAPSNEEI